jgi:Cytochrome C oxidase, cbb3-type, subunit III
MRQLKFIGGIGFTLVIVAGVGAAYLYSGAFNVAASAPHNAFEQSLFRTAMRRSVVVMSRSVSQRFTDDMVKDGLDHYEDMCGGCHGGPSGERSEIGKGLNPQAPDLADAVPAWSPRQLFWIVKNGLKMTGMPSFGKTHDDNQVWSIVAFIEQLPGMSYEQYQEMKHGQAAHQR